MATPSWSYLCFIWYDLFFLYFCAIQTQNVILALSLDRNWKKPSFLGSIEPYHEPWKLSFYKCRSFLTHGKSMAPSTTDLQPKHSATSPQWRRSYQAAKAAVVQNEKSHQEWEYQQLRMISPSNVLQNGFQTSIFTSAKHGKPHGAPGARAKCR